MIARLPCTLHGWPCRVASIVTRPRCHWIVCTTVLEADANTVVVERARPARRSAKRSRRAGGTSAQSAALLPFHSSSVAHVLTRVASAASKPSTNCARELPRGRRQLAIRDAIEEFAEGQILARTPDAAQAALHLLRTDCRRAPACRRAVSSARPCASTIAVLDFASQPSVAGARPWMNSAPSSIGNVTPGSRRVNMRPPRRSRASSTHTVPRCRLSSAAATSPAAPAPTIKVSNSSVSVMRAQLWHTTRPRTPLPQGCLCLSSSRSQFPSASPAYGA